MYPVLPYVRLPVPLAILPVLCLFIPAGTRAQVPFLTTVYPLPNTVGVLSTTPLTLTFSQAMSGATASPAVIPLLGEFTGRRPAAYSGAGSPTITLNPASPLLPGERATVVITPLARSTTGAPLVSGYSYSFRAQVAPGRALFPVRLEIPTGVPMLEVTAADFDGDGAVDLASALGAGVGCFFN
ncbi:MAG TPA: Ig-like domain-containing protein, partial [bacterium]|nr:Ig-like domain-containing protein [bacterium]